MIELSRLRLDDMGKLLLKPHRDISAADRIVVSAHRASPVFLSSRKTPISVSIPIVYWGLALNKHAAIVHSKRCPRHPATWQIPNARLSMERLPPASRTFTILPHPRFSLRRKRLGESQPKRRPVTDLTNMRRTAPMVSCKEVTWSWQMHLRE